MLEVKHLKKRFGDTEAVRDVSFCVEAGEIYGLLGPNGAGKTTTISMTCGLLKPDRGQVLVKGADFWKNPVQAQKAMGVVPQEIALYEDLTGEENLIYWGKVSGLSGRAAKLRAVEVLEALTLNSRKGDHVKTYSGGMKRRINIGCALMHDPKVILLDEPTVGIDPQARLKILEFVRRLADEGCAVLYTTHYLEAAEMLCNRIGIIDHGEILAEGTLAELQSRLGAAQLFVLEGDFLGAAPQDWAGFSASFNLIQHTESQMIAASVQERDPALCLQELLALPVRLDNVTLKKPSLNDVFIQLTGRDLRE